MAAAPQQQGQGGNSDNSLAPLWLTLLLFIAGFILWWTAHGFIVEVVFKIKLAQAYFVGQFTNQLSDVVAFMQMSSPSDVKPEQLEWAVTQVGNYVRWPMSGLLILLALILFKSDVTAKYRRTYSMKSLRDAEKDNWPQIYPVIKLDLTSEDIAKGPWAMSVAPIDFARRYKLLKVEVVPGGITGRRGRIIPTYTILKGDAKRIFTMQLGSYWEGPQALNQHTKALLAVFAARINHDRDAANGLLKQINLSIKTGKLDFSGTDKLLQKYFNTKKVAQIAFRHAYVLTVMASMLEEARNDGVLPVADFLWLKPIDRTLWFMLCTIGRQTPFPEVAGPFGHWLAEKELERKCLVPMVDEAVSGLEKAVKEIKYNPEDQEGVS